ncbi:hypothetical protein HMPREF1984_01999 [Leptotrichia sp. oral taxon 215 str. W9775]|uniref:hypothetical protein n=1 Tax=Leptotrichia sp. oral taxon 215 TaxID=712359 RepID=UPI0003ADB677|nr:hypothetical protein [Leptotrichia sp. oral taxon 215]ERK66058.1 hypothetical protein HMPREF1984_01999 [Leptotrichia sp. oral taxon 215 str. W9775]
MALYNNNKDANKTLKNVIGRATLFVIMAIISFFISVHLFSEKAKVIIKADIEVETEKLSNAIKNYKSRTGFFPELTGNENNLENIKSPDGKYSFDVFYGEKKLFAIPGNLEKGIEDSNSVVSVRNNKGGWLYNKTDGEVNPNIQ